MAKGALPGRRITVTLPFGPKSAVHVVYIKEPVAKYLDLNDTDPVTYKTKNNATNTKNNPGARAETVRYRTGSKSYKSWKVLFKKGGAKVGERTVDSISFPIPRYIGTHDVLKYLSKKVTEKKIFAAISPEGKRYILGKFE